MYPTKLTLGVLRGIVVSTIAVGVWMVANPSYARRAGNLYVNNSGTPTCSDATSKASNTAATPWCTLGRAVWGSTVRASPNTAEAADDDDIVLVTAGTYNTTQGGQEHYFVGYNPANSGSAGHPIIFRGVGTVYLTENGGATGPLIGSNDRHYITWDNFTINEIDTVTNRDTGPVVVYTHAGDANDTLNTTLINLTLNGDPSQAPATNDNHTGIRLNGSRGAIIRNNRISNFTNPNGNTANGVCIETYYTHDVLIENNELYGCGSGIFFKGNYSATWDPDFGSTVRYNYIHDLDLTNGNGLICHVQPSKPGNFVNWYGNIVSGSNVGMSIKLLNTGPNDAKLCRFINNVVYGTNKGFTVTAALAANSGNTFWNNIISTVAQQAVGIELNSTPTESEIDFEHNTYYTFNPFAEYGGANRTFAYWTGTLGFDTVSPAGTSTTNPIFANPTGDDFRLCTGSGVPHASCSGASPDLATGVDVLDLDGDASTTDNIPRGVYVTGNEVIGLTGGGSAVGSTGRMQLRIRKRE